MKRSPKLIMSSDITGNLIILIKRIF